MVFTKRLVGVALFLNLLISGSAFGQGMGLAKSSDYLTFLMIGSVADVDDISVTNGNLEERNTKDTVASFGVALGYDWSGIGISLRSEIEYHYRVRFDFDTRVTAVAGFENQLETHAVLLNAYYDWKTSERWKIYSGGGAGWAQNVSVTERVPIFSGTSSTRTDKSNNFCWNLSLGAIWSFADNLAADFRYRYIDLGEVDSGPHSDGRSINAGTYTSHDFIVGLTYKF